MDKAALRTLRPLFIALVSIFVVFAIGFSVVLYLLSHENISYFKIHGSSMSPTMLNGETVYLKKDTVKENGIVVFDYPDNWVKYSERTGNAFIIKRVKAVSGDTIFIKNSEIFMKSSESSRSSERDSKSSRSSERDSRSSRSSENFVKLAELPKNCAEVKNGDSYVVPKDSIFVMGDNQNASLDSVDMMCSEGFDKSVVSVSSIDFSGSILFSI